MNSLEDFTKQLKDIVLKQYGKDISDEACKQEYDSINEALNAKRNKYKDNSKEEE